MKPFTSTLVNSRPPEWVAAVRMLDRRELGPWRLIGRLVQDGRRGQPLILLGSVALAARYADLVAALALRLLRCPTRLVITDATWQFGSAALSRRIAARLPIGRERVERALERLSRLAIRALDGPNVIYCVLSTVEAAEFAQRWGVDASRVRFTPFCITLSPDQLEPPTDCDGAVFAGGNPVRDYDTLLEALGGLDDAPAVLATSTIAPERAAGLPSSIEAGPLSHERFVREMRRARVVVTPMAADIQRSAGQQTFLNAMALGKVVVVTDTPGVRDHIEDGVTGYVVPSGDAPALRVAIRRALDPQLADDHRAMGERAREAVLENFTTEDYLRRLLEIAHEPGVQA